MWDGYLSANYHSLQTTINKQFSKGLMIKGAYTYSKAINMTDDDGWAAVGWNWAAVFSIGTVLPPAMTALTFSRSDGCTNCLSAKGKGMLNSGPVSHILGNWQVNGIMASYTGVPFTVTAPNSSVDAPNNQQTADQVKLGRGPSGTHRF